MTATPSIGHPAPERNGHKIAERIRRGVDLYAERHQDIRHHGDRVEVPSCKGTGRYVVRLDPESCNCPDFEHHGAELGVCKHVVAAMIADAKRVEYRVVKRFDSRFGLDIHYVVETRAGVDRDVSRRLSSTDAYLDMWKMQGYDVGSVA